MQFPAEAHETDQRATRELDVAFPGRTASTPGAQCPAVSVNNSPCTWFASSRYEPTAVQFPREAQEIELTYVLPATAFAGSVGTVARQLIVVCAAVGADDADPAAKRSTKIPANAPSAPRLIQGRRTRLTGPNSRTRRARCLDSSFELRRRGGDAAPTALGSRRVASYGPLLTVRLTFVQGAR